MKLNKIILIILIVIVGVAGLVFITKAKPNNIQSQTITASPIPTIAPTPVASAYSTEVKAKVRNEFISSCETKGHYSAKECNCAADYLAKNYTESELAKIYVQYRVSSEIPAALEAASKACIGK